MELNSQNHKQGRIPVGVIAVINIIALLETHLWYFGGAIWNALRNARKNFNRYRSERSRKREEAALTNFLNARQVHGEHSLLACNHKGFIAGANNLQDLKNKLQAAGCSLTDKNLIVVEGSRNCDAATVFKSDGSVWLFFPELGEPIPAPGGKWSWPSN